MTLVIIILGGFVFSGAVKLTGWLTPPFVVMRDMYYFAVGTFTIWALVLNEIIELVMVKSTLGHQRPSTLSAIWTAL